MVEVLKALTPRLADSQSNLKPLAASALAEVASSVGADSSPKVHGPCLWVALLVMRCYMPIHLSWIWIEACFSPVELSACRCVSEVVLYRFVLVPMPRCCDPKNMYHTTDPPPSVL